MKKKTKLIHNEQAVSPVIGVMLMLVATIVLAAAVSSFSGGLATTTGKAPQASFDVKIRGISTGMMTPEFVMKHLGGDPVVTKDVKLVTKWTDESGTLHMQETTAPTYNASANNTYFPGSTTHYNLTTLNTKFDDGTSTIHYHAPYLAIPGDMPADGSGREDNLWFGNYTITRGDVIKAQINLKPGTGSYENQATPIIKDVELLERGDVVTVELIDLNTNNKIFSKDVVVR